MKIRTITLVGFAMVVAAGAGFTMRRQLSQSRNLSPAFTLISRRTHYHPDGRQYQSQVVRYAASNGAFRVIQTRPDGWIREFFFDPTRGHFRVNHREGTLVQFNKVPLERLTPPKVATAEEFLSSKQFIRTETVLGFTAYLLRHSDKTTGQLLAETYLVPQLGHVPLKEIAYENGRAAYLTEPLKLILGEPDPALVKGPDFSVAKQ